MAAGKYPSCLLGSRACRTGWLRTVIFLLSVALALNLGLLLGVRLLRTAARRFVPRPAKPADGADRRIHAAPPQSCEASSRLPQL